MMMQYRKWFIFTLIALVLAAAVPVSAQTEKDDLVSILQQVAQDLEEHSQNTTNDAADQDACSTPEEFVQYLRQTGEEASNYYVSFKAPCTPELMAQLKADDETLLHQLELEAGMVEPHYGYGSEKYIEYRNAVFCFDVPHLTSEEDYELMLEQALQTQPKDLYFTYDPSLSGFIENQKSLIGNWFETTVNESYDIGVYSFTTTTWTGIEQMQITSYAEGAVIARAYETGDTSQLSSSEREAYDRAVSIIQGLTSTDDYGKAKEIHDIICSITSYDYEKDSSNRHDARGVLVDGFAVCDGYADAYYLLCRMAGLDVRKVSGWIGENPAVMFDASLNPVDTENNHHAWNLIQLGGKWLMVDVTWDDTTETDAYFLVGKQEAISQGRNWNESLITRRWSD